MEFFGYDTCDKLIWTSSEVSIITNKTNKQVIPKTHTNKAYLSPTFGFGCSPHKYTCDILPGAWFHPNSRYIHQKSM